MDNMKVITKETLPLIRGNFYHHISRNGMGQEVWWRKEREEQENRKTGEADLEVFF